MTSDDETIRRTRKTTGIHQYFIAKQKILELQRGILTGALPHMGERGRNDEVRVKEFLRHLLPQRFGICSGFVRNSIGDISNQTDIIIFDQLYNFPIFEESAAQVHAIESVYAFVEVKGTLSKHYRANGQTDLDKVLEDISKIRQLADDKHYVFYKSEPKDPEHPKQLVAKKYSYSIPLAPRGYLFAFHSEGWRSLEDFAASAEKALHEHMDAHIHGAIVLDRDWLVVQQPHADARSVWGYDKDALLLFVSRLLDGIQSMPMNMLDFDRYISFSEDIPPNVDTENSGFSVDEE